MSSTAFLGLVTLVVAAGTVGLAFVTYRQGRLSRRALDLSIRPLLADPLPGAEGERDNLLFGAPGRISVEVAKDELFYQGDGTGAFHLSVPFQNIGAGAAAIVNAELSGDVSADVYTSRKFVPVGATVRVNIALLTELPGAERFRDHWWAMDGVTVSIHYTDLEGRQPLVSRAVIRQAATKDPWVAEIAVFRAGEDEAISVGRGSY